METSLYLVSNVIRIYAISIFLDSFFGNLKCKRIIKIIAYISYYFIGSLVWIISQNTNINLVINTAAIILISILYRATWKKRVFSAIWVCAVGMFIDWIAFSILGNSQFVQSGFLQYVLLLDLAFLFRHLYHRHIEYSSKSPYFLLILLVSLGTIAVGILTVNDSSKHDIIVAIILLLINLINFYTYHLEQDRLKNKHMVELIQASNDAYQNQLKIMETSQREMRYLRHDIQKHLNTMRRMLQEKEYAEVQEYLTTIENAIIVKEEYSKTGNRDVDSLINYELALASDLGTAIMCRIDLPAELNISSFDMTVILGNLLDNAIEALRQSENKRLLLSMKLTRGIVRIDIENSYNPKQKKKADQKQHGIGLLSVSHTLEKYHGDLKHYVEDNNKYHTTVTMFNGTE